MGKKTKGKFEKNGRRKRSRSTAHDYGNDRVLDRLVRFRRFNPAIRNEDVDDGPGQAHVAGLFNTPLADSKALRDVAREYGDLYWYEYADRRAKSANLERSAKGHGSDIPDLPLPELAAWLEKAKTARDKRFKRLDAAFPMRSPARNALHDLSVNSWGSDQPEAFVERLIATAEAKRRFPTTYPMLATEADQRLWEALLNVLIDLVQGEQRKAA